MQEKGGLLSSPELPRAITSTESCGCAGIAYNMMLLDEQKLPEWCAAAAGFCTLRRVHPKPGTRRIKEVAEGQQKIPFMLELDSAKWCALFCAPAGTGGKSWRCCAPMHTDIQSACRLHDSDKMYPYIEEK